MNLIPIKSTCNACGGAKSYWPGVEVMAGAAVTMKVVLAGIDSFSGVQVRS